MNRLLSSTPLGIRFGDYIFSEPIPLNRFAPPSRSVGLYAMLMSDPTWGPWALQPLFFGEFGPHSEVYMTPAQQTSCLRVAAGRSLYVAVYALPQQYGGAVSQIKKELIERYGPISNTESADAAAELSSRLNSLEKKMFEQEAALKLILATIGQMAQLQPEPRKRVLGFQPAPADSHRGYCS